MSELEVLDYRNFDFDNLVYNKPRKTQGKYLGKVKYKQTGKKTHDRIIIQTPKLYCLDDVHVSDDRCTLELEISNNNIDFYQFLINFDDKNITTAYINSKFWFDQQFPMDIIDEFYKPFIKMTRNKNPSIKVKIEYDELKNFNHDDFKKGNELSLWLECTGLKFLKQQFSMEWKILKIENTTENDYYNKNLTDRAEESEMHHREMGEYITTDENLLDELADHVTDDIVEIKEDVEEIPDKTTKKKLAKKAESATETELANETEPAKEELTKEEPTKETELAKDTEFAKEAEPDTKEGKEPTKDESAKDTEFAKEEEPENVESEVEVQNSEDLSNVESVIPDLVDSKKSNKKTKKKSNKKTKKIIKYPNHRQRIWH